jgi:hypothetical protein
MAFIGNLFLYFHVIFFDALIHHKVIRPLRYTVFYSNQPFLHSFHFMLFQTTLISAPVTWCICVNKFVALELWGRISYCRVPYTLGILLLIRYKHFNHNNCWFYI